MSSASGKKTVEECSGGQRVVCEWWPGGRLRGEPCWSEDVKIWMD